MKTDCFAYNKGVKHRCAALKTPCCEDCKFYKTKKQYTEALKQLSFFGRYYGPCH